MTQGAVTAFRLARCGTSRGNCLICNGGMVLGNRCTAKATGQAVAVIPGGGYRGVYVEFEGYATAEYFKSIGVTAVVVKYRLPNYGHKEVPLEDIQEALRFVRKNADRLGVDPNQVGVCGGSAGGHLAAYASTFIPDDEKPAFSILFYPVITGETWESHQDSFVQLLGKNRTVAEQEYYSLHNRVTPTTPPALITRSPSSRRPSRIRPASSTSAWLRTAPIRPPITCS